MIAELPPTLERLRKVREALTNLIAELEAEHERELIHVDSVDHGVARNPWQVFDWLADES